MFNDIFETKLKAEMRRNPDKPDYHIVLRNTIFMCFLPQIFFCFLHALISEGAAVFYSFYIGNMIKFVKDPDAPWSEGVKTICIFVST